MTEHVVFASFCDHPFLFRGWHMYCYPVQEGIAVRPSLWRGGWLDEVFGGLYAAQKAALAYGVELPDPGHTRTQEYVFKQAFVEAFGPDGIRVLTGDWRGRYEVPAEFVAEHPTRRALLVDFGYGIDQPFRPSDRFRPGTCGGLGNLKTAAPKPPTVRPVGVPSWRTGGCAGWERLK